MDGEWLESLSGVEIAILITPARGIKPLSPSFNKINWKTILNHFSAQLLLSLIPVPVNLHYWAGACKYKALA